MKFQVKIYGIKKKVWKKRPILSKSIWKIVKLRRQYMYGSQQLTRGTTFQAVDNGGDRNCHFLGFARISKFFVDSHVKQFGYNEHQHTTSSLLPTAREGNVFKGVCPPTRGIWILGGVCLMDNPPLVTSSGGHCSSWYAFYWNAFLFWIFLPVVIGTMRIFQLYLDESEHCVT